jgi:hypothetical protein
VFQRAAFRCRPGTDGIETIEVDIWTTLLPPGNFTAQTVWQDQAPPNARVWNRTGQFNVSMNVTFVNATTYTVWRSPPSLPGTSNTCSSRELAHTVARQDSCRSA